MIDYRFMMKHDGCDMYCWLDKGTRLFYLKAVKREYEIEMVISFDQLNHANFDMMEFVMNDMTGRLLEHIKLEVKK